MLNRMVADGIVIVHALFVLFAVAGGLLVLRWPRLAWLHLPALSWAAWIAFSGHFCPLTVVENMFREMAAGVGYREGFINHYLLPVLYPPGLTRFGQIVLGGVLLAGNGVVYWWLFRRRASGKKG